MAELYDDTLQNALALLFNIKGFSEFHEEYCQRKEIGNRTDFFKMLFEFKELLISKNKLGEDEKILI